MVKFIFLYVALNCNISLDVNAQDSKFFVNEKISDKRVYVDIIKHTKGSLKKDTYHLIYSKNWEIPITLKQ